MPCRYHPTLPFSSCLNFFFFLSFFLSIYSTICPSPPHISILLFNQFSSRRPFCSFLRSRLMGDLSSTLSPTWDITAIPIHLIRIVFTLVLCPAGYPKVPECWVGRRGGEGSPHCCLPKTGLFGALVGEEIFQCFVTVTLRQGRKRKWGPRSMNCCCSFSFVIRQISVSPPDPKRNHV